MFNFFSIRRFIELLYKHCRICVSLVDGKNIFMRPVSSVFSRITGKGREWIENREMRSLQCCTPKELPG